jgi:hypothetical protein
VEPNKKDSIFFHLLGKVEPKIFMKDGFILAHKGGLYLSAKYVKKIKFFGSTFPKGGLKGGIIVVPNIPPYQVYINQPFFVLSLG